MAKFGNNNLRGILIFFAGLIHIIDISILLDNQQNIFSNFINENKKS